MSPKQRAAIFEKLKTASMSAKTPQVPKEPKIMGVPKAPSVPKMPGAPKMSEFNDINTKGPTNSDQVNDNFVGKPKKQRFMKLKKFSGF